jgi:hypothetical protein
MEEHPRQPRGVMNFDTDNYIRRFTPKKVQERDPKYGGSTGEAG